MTKETLKFPRGFQQKNAKIAYKNDNKQNLTKLATLLRKQRYKNIIDIQLYPSLLCHFTNRATILC